MNRRRFLLGRGQRDMARGDRGRRGVVQFETTVAASAEIEAILSVFGGNNQNHR